MPPSRGRRELWLSLRNSTDKPKQFNFEVEGTPYRGSILVEADELLNIFKSDVGKKYTIFVETEDSKQEKYLWDVVEGNESLVAEITEEEFRFKEMNIL